MYTTIFLLLFGLGCHHKKPDAAPNNTQYTTRSQAQNFLYEAFLTGLKEDNVSKEMVKIIANSNIFVPKCPICDTTRKALSAYKGPNLLKKQNLPDEIITGMNGSREQKMEALKQLTSRYTQRHIQKQSIPEEALENLTQLLEKMRKQGMKTKPSNFGDYCPSCEGVLL